MTLSLLLSCWAAPKVHVSANLKPHQSIFVDVCKCNADSLIVLLRLIIRLDAEAASLSGFR